MSNDKLMTSEEFIAGQIEINNLTGFWAEGYKSTLIRAVESHYNTPILKDMYIEDIIINGDKTLIKWGKRFRPLTDEEVSEKYNR